MKRITTTFATERQDVSTVRTLAEKMKEAATKGYGLYLHFSQVPANVQAPGYPPETVTYFSIKCGNVEEYGAEVRQHHGKSYARAQKEAMLLVLANLRQVLEETINLTAQTIGEAETAKDEA